MAGLAAGEWFHLGVHESYKRDIGLEHALGELKANADDASKPEQNKQALKSNTLTITNSGPPLIPEHLLMGYSGKRDDPDKVGHHGLGLKDAVVILMRLGYEVVVHSHGTTYEFAMMPYVPFVRLDGDKSLHCKLKAGQQSKITTVTITSASEANTLLLKAGYQECFVMPSADVASPSRSQQAPAKRKGKRNLASSNGTPVQPAKKAAATPYFTLAPRGRPGQIECMSKPRSHLGPPLQFDWHLGPESKKWFSSNQVLEQERKFINVTMPLLLKKVKLEDLRPGTFEYEALLPSQRFKLRAAATTAVFTTHVISSVGSAIEKLNRGMAEHHRRTKYLVAEVQDVLQNSSLKVAEFFPAGSFAKSTELPHKSDLDLIMVYNQQEGKTIATATKSKVDEVMAALQEAFPTRMRNLTCTAFSAQCLLDGVEVDILPVSHTIWKASTQARDQAPEHDKAYYSAAMATAQIEDFQRRAQAQSQKGLDVRPAIRLIKAWLAGHGPWEAATKPRSCVIEELTLQAAESGGPYLTQQQLAHRVIELCASLKSPVSLADPIYAPNNLARGLKPEVLVGYAKTALADWPRSFLQRMDLPTGA